ncbi:hypothetical protein ACLX1H_000105 [Fusarium chlamydosporum]
MHVPTTFGRLILGASLCAARACAPHPRSSTVSTYTSDVDTTIATGSSTIELATSTSVSTAEDSVIATGSDTTSEVSMATATSIIDSSAAIETDTTTALLTESDTSSELPATTAVESSATDTSTTEVTTTGALTTMVTESSTFVPTSVDTAVEDVTSTALVELPVQTVELLENGGFDTGDLDPWTLEPSLAGSLSTTDCRDGASCLKLTGPSPITSVCQNVQVPQGYEYTFTAHVLQDCGNNNCVLNNNGYQLSVNGVYAGVGQLAQDRTYHELTGQFELISPDFSHYFVLDSVSFTQGKAVPVPEEED